MKKIWNGFVTAFAMYSRIPMPKADWEAQSMQYSLCFFPWVGLVIGALEYGWFLLSESMGFGDLFRSAGMTLLPILVTGGIHMDGLLDTMDALSSWREKEQRLKILKDPHAGAFAVISGGCYLIVYLGASSMVKSASLPFFCLSFVVSRCMSVFALCCFQNANPDGSAAAFSGYAKKKTVMIVMGGTLFVVFAFLCQCNLFLSLIYAVTTALVFLFYYYKSRTYFGGITGDLAGYFVLLCELWLLLVSVVVCCGMEKWI